MKCSKCGDDFRISEARSDYNNYVSAYNVGSEFKQFNFQFDYDGDSYASEHVCFYCARDIIEEEVGDAMYAAGIEEISDEDEPDEGCVACGNPNYPLCKLGCSAFDE